MAYGDSIRCASPTHTPRPSAPIGTAAAEDQRADPSWRRRSGACGGSGLGLPGRGSPLPRAGGGVQTHRAVRLTLTRFPAFALGLVAGLAALPGPERRVLAPGELIVRFRARRGRPRAGGDPRACGGRLRQPGYPCWPSSFSSWNRARGGARPPGRARRRADRVMYAEANFYRRASLRPNIELRQRWSLENLASSAACRAPTSAASAAWDIIHRRPRTLVAVVDSGVSTSIPTWRGPVGCLAGQVRAWGQSHRRRRDGLIDVRGWDWVGADADPGSPQQPRHPRGGVAGARADNGQGVAGVVGARG